MLDFRPFRRPSSGASMADNNTRAIVRRIESGDEAAVDELMQRHREQLRRMVELRLDNRLKRRVDASDILQETFIEAANRLERYVSEQPVPFYVWLRTIAGEKIQQAWRFHSTTQARDIQREVRIDTTGVPEATSESIAVWLAGHQTSPSGAAIRHESRRQVQEVLDELDEVDREVLVLRHFEQLSNVEAAEALGIDASAASNRYVRALKRLRQSLAKYPQAASAFIPS